MAWGWGVRAAGLAVMVAWEAVAVTVGEAGIALVAAAFVEVGTVRRWSGSKGTVVDSQAHCFFSKTLEYSPP